MLLYVTYFDFILISEDADYSGELTNAAEFTKYLTTNTVYTIKVGGTDYFAKNTIGGSVVLGAGTASNVKLPACATANPTAAGAATKSPTAAAAGASTSAPLPVLTAALATLDATLFW